MSDAERSGGEPGERLDWGDGNGDDSTHSSGDGASEVTGPSGAARDETDTAEDDGADLCVLEDPTCEACQ